MSFVTSEECLGLYFADIIPSKLGSYSLTLKGNINTQYIDNDIPLEDIEDAKKITFPIIADDSGNIDNIGKQIIPIINNLTNQIDELKKK